MKTAVITGASRGIGLAATKPFLSHGWRVIGTFNHHQIPLQSDHLVAVKLDQSSPDSITEAAEQIAKAAPSIDVLVNNAAVLLDGLDSGFNATVVRATFEANLFGVIDLTGRLLPHLHPGSHVINVGSDFGTMSDPIGTRAHAGYRLSKAALHMYTRVLAYHLGDQKILVSSIDPGWVNTDMGREGTDEAETPDRDPAEVGPEIFDLATKVRESGQFWHRGRKRAW